MLIQKLSFQLKRLNPTKLKHWLARLKQNGFSASTFILLFALALLIISLNYNTYQAVINAVQDYQTLGDTKEQLSELQADQQVLEQNLEYYRSVDFRERYAYDSLNLAKPGESVYLVETSSRVSYDLETENTDPIVLHERQLWWDLLFQQISFEKIY